MVNESATAAISGDAGRDKSLAEYCKNVGPQCHYLQHTNVRRDSTPTGLAFRNNIVVWRTESRTEREKAKLDGKRQGR